MFNHFKKLRVFFLAALLLSVGSAAFADVSLPAPQRSGGPGVLDAISSRASANGADFAAMGEVSLEKLSTILWAATGLNRGEKGWTVPMAKGMEPYARVYVAKADGVFLYDWKNHALKEISKEDVRGRLGRAQYVSKAPATLIFVSDGAALSKEYKDDALVAQFATGAVGAMTQNVYLASQSQGVRARYVYSANRDEINKILSLPGGDEVICIMPLGAQAAS